MIAVLLSALALAAGAADAPAATPAPPVPPPAGPPHERPIIESQLARSRPAAAATLSGVEADRLYSLYLSRIGQAPQDAGASAVTSNGAIGGSESPAR